MLVSLVLLVFFSRLVVQKFNGLFSALWLKSAIFFSAFWFSTYCHKLDSISIGINWTLESLKRTFMILKINFMLIRKPNITYSSYFYAICRSVVFMLYGYNFIKLLKKYVLRQKGRDETLTFLIIYGYVSLGSFTRVMIKDQLKRVFIFLN